MRRAQRRKYHYFYKTTCIVTNKYYYGIHSTDNLDDGYIGSGKRLWHSINKHGKENHKIEILKFFETREKLRDWEIKVVNEDLLKDPNCMNLSLGGEGGFHNEEHRIKFQSAGGSKMLQLINKQHQQKLKTDKEYKNRWRKSISKSLSGEKNPFYRKKHSEETKEKMRNADRTAGKNSQYGTCWITNEKESKKIYRGDLIPEGWRLGRKMKK